MSLSKDNESIGDEEFDEEEDEAGFDASVMTYDVDLSSASESELVLSESDTGEVQYTDGTSYHGYKLGMKERAGLIKARKQLDESDKFKQRSEAHCQALEHERSNVLERIKDLEEECSRVFAQLQDAIENSDKASKGRLTARYHRVCIELSVARQQDSELLQQISEAGYNRLRCEALVEAVKKNDGEIEEMELRRDIEDEAAARDRLRIEKRNARRSVRWAKELEKENKGNENLINQQLESKSEDEQSVCHPRIKKQRSVGAAQSEVIEKEGEVQRELPDILKLKQSVSDSYDRIKLSNYKAELKHAAEEEEERKWREEMTARGLNATREIMRHKYAQDMEEKYRQYSEKRRQGEVRIVEKLLNEREEMYRRKERLPELFPDPKADKAKIVAPHPRRAAKILRPMQRSAQLSAQYPTEYTDYDNVARRNNSQSDEEDKSACQSYLSNQTTAATEPCKNDVDYAVPEFEGLWDERRKPLKNVHVHDKRVLTMVPQDAPEMDIKRRMESHVRMNLVQQQTAGGRLFKGDAPFKSKPDVILFKDIELGKTYRKKVVLTNVTLTLTYCKLAGLSDSLKDSVEICFNPPGHISAGMTCDFLVTFRPKVSVDLEGEVFFIGQAGTFSIPIVCRTKKCEISVDTTHVDFGSTVIGETIRKVITLTNTGSLPAHFDFKKVPRVHDLNDADITVSAKLLGENKSCAEQQEAASTSQQQIDKSRADPVSESPVLISPPCVDRVERPDLGQGTPILSQVESIAPHFIDKSHVDGEHIATPSLESVKKLSLSSEIAPADPFVPEAMPVEEILVGEGFTGILDPCSSASLELLYLPIMPGTTCSTFHIVFLEPNLDTIEISAVGRATDVPVWVETPVVDLKICTYDKLYQDSIAIQNGGPTALKANFQICKGLRDHLEILPKTAVLQPHSRFSAQLKFLPRRTLCSDAREYFDPDTGVLEVLIAVNIVGQTLPLTFTVYAVVTNSDLSFDQQYINFGHCTIYERSRASIIMTNLGLLPQTFGFVGVPDCIDIQPNDGFGTILPNEILTLDIMFQPNQADCYCFDLVCKTLGSNRQFKIRCEGVGVHPPASLSHQIVRFPATALYDSSSVSLRVASNHVKLKHAHQAVPRIGQGDVAPRGPVSFQFVVPEDSPVSVSPAVGVILPNQSCSVTVRFSPVLDDMEIRRQAVRLWTEERQRHLEIERQKQMDVERENEKMEQLHGKKDQKKKPAKDKIESPDHPDSPEQDLSADRKSESVPVLDECSILPGSAEYTAGYLSLVKGFIDKMETITIPCHLVSGDCTQGCALTDYSPHNTLYLELCCPTVRPELILISECCGNVVDFGGAALRQNIIKSLTLQNISSCLVHVRSSCLNTEGPFELVNALRPMAPGDVQAVKISFKPDKIELFQEALELHGSTSTVSVTLKGLGICPVVNVSVENGLFDLGDIIAGEFKQESFKIHNVSGLPVDYTIRLDSHSFHHRSRQLISTVIHKHDPLCRQYVGTQNKNSQQVFECIPLKGSIEPGAIAEVAVIFFTDHASEHFIDRCHIDLLEQKDAYVFLMQGRSYSNNIYITGGDELTSGADCLALPARALISNESAKFEPLLITLYSEPAETGYASATGSLTVCCIKSQLLGGAKKLGKANGEFLIENVSALGPLGFHIEPLKSTVEAGTEKKLNVTWTPPVGHDCSKSVFTTVDCLMKGDATTVYKLYLQGFIITK